LRHLVFFDASSHFPKRLHPTDGIFEVLECDGRRGVGCDGDNFM
jgi:hypothetical protein